MRSFSYFDCPNCHFKKSLLWLNAPKHVILKEVVNKYVKNVFECQTVFCLGCNGMVWTYKNI